MNKSDSNFFDYFATIIFNTLKTSQMVHTAIDGAIFNDILPIQFIEDSNVAP